MIIFIIIACSGKCSGVHGTSLVNVSCMFVHCSPHDLSEHRAGLLPGLCTVRLPHQGPAGSQQDKHALAGCQLPPALRLS